MNKTTVAKLRSDRNCVVQVLIVSLFAFASGTPNIVCCTVHVQCDAATG